MDRSSLNRAIGLALSALRLATGEARGWYRGVVRNLNRARRSLDGGRVHMAAAFIRTAESFFRVARSYRAAA